METPATTAVVWTLCDDTVTCHADCERDVQTQQNNNEYDNKGNENNENNNCNNEYNKFKYNNNNCNEYDNSNNNNKYNRCNKYNKYNNNNYHVDDERLLYTELRDALTLTLKSCRPDHMQVI